MFHIIDEDSRLLEIMKNSKSHPHIFKKIIYGIYERN